ncbi:MAG: 2-C-methyl-D-erythritol 2,4-cyclodiphosphate synthase [Gammaproteobacteria bacterium]|nr:MAG: 2-C-methyl-D-erythritol 2,4-cyclodiphosphate synthase [Gammaproteobacteria bacterium]
MRVGIGYDLHRFGPGDHVLLGGVRIATTRGVVAHSDGDVLLHALMDALLGAAGLGDIGTHFPNNDPRFAGANSRALLAEVVRLIAARSLVVANCDLVLIAEEPRLAPHREAICAHIAADLGIGRTQVNVKATTAEGLGALGRAEGIAAQAIVLLQDGDEA